MQKGFEEEVQKRRSLSALLDGSRLRSSVVPAGGIFDDGRRRRRRRRRRRLTSDFTSEEEEEDEDEDEEDEEEDEDEEEEEDEENVGDFANVVRRHQRNYNLTDRKSYSLPHGWRSRNLNDNENGSSSDSLMATFIRGEPLVKSDRCIKSDVVEGGMRTLRLTVKNEERRMRLRVNVNPNEFRRRRDLMVQWFQEFGDEQKNILLKELMKNCGTPQNHLLSVAIEPVMHLECPPNCQDFLTWLPKPLSLYIVCFLDPVSLSQCSKVCRAWHSLTNHSFLWQRFCNSPQWQLSSPDFERKQLTKCRLPDGSVHWKKVFSERFRLFRNWMKGYCHVRTFEGHTQGISCVQFDDTRIVSGSSDKTIKVWNIRTNSRWSVMTLVGHSGTVRCLHLEGNRLVSGSTDRSIKVWDLSSNSGWSSIACKVTMIGHRDTVRCLQVDDEKVVSGSYDQTLKVWDVRTGECKLTLGGHEGAVLCVQHDETKIVSGSCDRTIKIWNFVPGVCINTLHGHHDAVTCLQFDSRRIISGSLDRTIKFWNLLTGQCLSTLDWMKSEGHTGVIRCLQADRWRIVSAGDDKTLKVWSLETGQRLVTLKNHTDGVTCLQFNDYVIVSGSYDKTVKLWDFSVC